MTFKSLLNWGGFPGRGHSLPMERYHGGSWEHKSHGHYRGGGGKGSSAALSALTLLAFLFLLHVMQQSLTATTEEIAPTTAAALFLRDDTVFNAKEQRIALKSSKEKDQKERGIDNVEDDEEVDEFKKGDSI